MIVFASSTANLVTFLVRNPVYLVSGLVVAMLIIGYKHIEKECDNLPR